MLFYPIITTKAYNLLTFLHVSSVLQGINLLLELLSNGTFNRLIARES